MTNKQRIEHLVDQVNEALSKKTFYADCVSHYGGWQLNREPSLAGPKTTLEADCTNRLRMSSKEFIAFLEGLLIGLTNKN